MKSSRILNVILYYVGGLVCAFALTLYRDRRAITEA